MSFALGLCVGVALGLIVIGFLAIGAYERGYEAAWRERERWKLSSERPRATVVRRHAA